MVEAVAMMPLHEVPAFKGLGDIAKEFEIDFTLFGGAATRAWMYMQYRPGEDFDLFDLTPFTSDIDLRHSGDKSDTPHIMQAIHETIPFAPWCRWALQDAQTGAKAERNRGLSTRVPLRSLTLSTLEDLEIPDEALEDLDARQVSFERNENYRHSGLSEEGRDIEIFGLIMSLNVLADIREIAQDGELFADEEGALSWMLEEESLRQLSASADSDPLTTRLWHLLASHMARTKPGFSPVADRLIEVAAGTESLRSAQVNLQQVFFDGAPLTASKMTATGGFRVPELSPDIMVGSAARLGFEALCADLRHAGLSEGDLPEIDPAFELIAMVPYITVRAAPDAAEKGRMAEEDDDENPDSVFESWSPADFLHLAWADDGGGSDDLYPANLDPANLDPAGMTACVVPRVADRSYGWASAAAVGGRFAAGRNWIRVDLQDAVDRTSKPADKPASVLILQSRL